MGQFENNFQIDIVNFQFEIILKNTIFLSLTLIIHEFQRIFDIKSEIWLKIDGSF